MKKLLSLIAFQIFFIVVLCSSAFSLVEGVLISEISRSSGVNSYESYDWAALNENGVVCFRGASKTSSAILKADTSTIDKIADTKDPSGLFNGFVTGICSINDSGEVAFDACRNCNSTAPLSLAALNPGGLASSNSLSTAAIGDLIEYGVYKRSPGGILSVIQESGSGINDYKTVSFPSLNSQGQVLFSGELNNGVFGIWKKDGANLSTVVDSSGIFLEVGAGFLNDNSQVTFAASEDGDTKESGIYGPQLNRVLGTFNGYPKVSLPVINLSGNIAVMAKNSSAGASSAGEQGVYLDGAPLVINNSQFEQVDISPFQAVSMNDRGDVLFPAISADGTQSAFLYVAGNLIPLIQSGDKIPGQTSPIEAISVSREAINNARQVALSVVLKDRKEFVIRIDPNGVSYDNDLCPQDISKLTPGACGCGVADSDDDGDGIPNCQVHANVKQLSTDLTSAIKKLKPTAKLNKAKKAAAKVVLSEAKSLFNRLNRLIDGSSSFIQLKSDKQQIKKYLTNIKRDVRKAFKVNNGSFSEFKKKSLKSLTAFSKILT